jgi:hypothetical protein
VVGVFAVAAFASSAGPLRTAGSDGLTREPSPAKLDAMKRAIALLPGDAAVSASNRIGAHLSERRRIFIFPVRAQADWIVVDHDDPISEAAAQPAYRAAVAAILVDPAWAHVFDESGVHVLRRRAT